MCRSPGGNNLDSFMFSPTDKLVKGSSVLVKQLISVFACCSLCAHFTLLWASHECASSCSLFLCLQALTKDNDRRLRVIMPHLFLILIKILDSTEEQSVDSGKIWIESNQVVAQSETLTFYMQLQRSGELVESLFCPTSSGLKAWMPSFLFQSGVSSG